MNYSHRIIYWDTVPVNPPEQRPRQLAELDADGKRGVRVHLLVGYCPNTLAYFQKMAEELRKTFPEAKDEDITCSMADRSSSVNRHTIISWRGKLAPGEYPEYRQISDGSQQEYDFPN